MTTLSTAQASTAEPANRDSWRWCLRHCARGARAACASFALPERPPTPRAAVGAYAAAPPRPPEHRRQQRRHRITFAVVITVLLGLHGIRGAYFGGATPPAPSTDGDGDGEDEDASVRNPTLLSPGAPRLFLPAAKCSAPLTNRGSFAPTARDLSFQAPTDIDAATLLELPTDAEWLRTSWRALGGDRVFYTRTMEEMERKARGTCAKALDVLAWITDAVRRRDHLMMIGYGELIHLHREGDFVDEETGSYLDDDIDTLVSLKTLAFLAELEPELFRRFGWTIRFFLSAKKQPEPRQKRGWGLSNLAWPRFFAAKEEEAGSSAYRESQARQKQYREIKAAKKQPEPRQKRGWGLSNLAWPRFFAAKEEEAGSSAYRESQARQKEYREIRARNKQALRDRLVSTPSARTRPAAPRPRPPADGTGLPIRPFPTSSVPARPAASRPPRPPAVASSEDGHRAERAGRRLTEEWEDEQEDDEGEEKQYVTFAQIVATCGHAVVTTPTKAVSSEPAIELYPLVTVDDGRGGERAVLDLWQGVKYPESMLFPVQERTLASAGTKERLHLQLPHEPRLVMKCLYGDWTRKSNMHAQAARNCLYY